MIRKYVLRTCRPVLSIILFALAGCSSYEPVGSADSIPGLSNGADANEVMVTDESVEVRLIPLFDREKAKSYLGIDPARSRIMPALVRVVNAGNEPVKVELPDSYLVIDPNERWETLTLSQAIHRGLRSDAEVVGWMIVFGMPAWYAAAGNAATVNRTLEEDYHAKHFKPTLINAGGAGQGIVFFDVEQTRACHVSGAVIRIRRLTTDACSDIHLVMDHHVLAKQ